MRGELWRVDATTFARLDEFEDVRLFARRRIEIEGVAEPVFAYLYVGTVSELKECGDSWPMSP